MPPGPDQLPPDIMPSGPVGTSGTVPIVPVLVAPSPRVLWAARSNEVGLALWPRRPLPPLVAQVEAVMRASEFDLAVEGTLPELNEALRRSPAAAAPGGGPLATDVAILAALYAQVAGCSALRLQLRFARHGNRRPLAVAEGRLTLLCCYAGAGVEWQDAMGTVRRMPPSHVGLFKGRDWPDNAIRAPWRLPSLSPVGPGRLLLRLDRVVHA